MLTTIFKLGWRTCCLMIHYPHILCKYLKLFIFNHNPMYILHSEYIFFLYQLSISCLNAFHCFPSRPNFSVIFNCKWRNPMNVHH